jgi:hypothetical protein
MMQYPCSFIHVDMHIHVSGNHHNFHPHEILVSVLTLVLILVLDLCRQRPSAGRYAQSGRNTKDANKLTENKYIYIYIEREREIISIYIIYHCCCLGLNT